jgi:hypothetical protein
LLGRETTTRGVVGRNTATDFLAGAIDIAIACCRGACEEGEEDARDVEVHFYSDEIVLPQRVDDIV